MGDGGGIFTDAFTTMHPFDRGLEMFLISQGSQQAQAVSKVQPVSDELVVTNQDTGIFSDVPVDHFARPFIDEMFNRGITNGCDAGPPRLYCPDASVSRAQMAVFIIRAMDGPPVEILLGSVNLEGSGQQASSMFNLNQGLAIFRMTHDGNSNFIIRLLDAQGNSVTTSLVNEIGSFDGSKAVHIDESGTYLLDISADGNWTVRIEQ